MAVRVTIPSLMEREPLPPEDRSAGSERYLPGPPPIVARASRRPLPPSVNLACFLLTVVTTLIAGALFTMDVAIDDSFWRTVVDVALTPKLWTLGLPYAFSLIAILGAHEMGHYVACKIYRIDATLPFFLPGPPIIGTFGAVIRIRAPFTTRRALFDVGVAGPIAGFVVALPVLAYGLSQSVISHKPPGHGEIGLPSCLLLDFAYRLFFHDLAPGEALRLHPAVAAAWFGCLATFLNLIPIGQLDGGHMLYALSRRLHRPVSLAATIGLIACGALTQGIHLIFFGLLWVAIGARHPPVLDESSGLGFGRIMVAVLGLLIFVLCFIPGSIQIS